MLKGEIGEIWLFEMSSGEGTAWEGMAGRGQAPLVLAEDFLTGDVENLSVLLKAFPIDCIPGAVASGKLDCTWRSLKRKEKRIVFMLVGHSIKFAFQEDAHDRGVVDLAAKLGSKLKTVLMRRAAIKEVYSARLGEFS